MIKVAALRHKLEDRRSDIISNIHGTSEYLVLLRNLKSLKRLSKYIPFPCEFDKKGHCNGVAKGNDMCCCNCCHENLGYLNYVPETHLKFYAKWFSVKTGFWRKGKGCVLPRDYRSATCLTFYCGDGDITDFDDELHAYKNAIHTAENNFRNAMRKEY